jgi:hypothetical protein
MDNIIKKVEIIEGLLADIEREVTNLYINKFIFNKTKIIFGKITTIEYDLNHNVNICFTNDEDGETCCFCSINIDFVHFVNKGVCSILLNVF